MKAGAIIAMRVVALVKPRDLLHEQKQTHEMSLLDSTLMRS